NKTVYSINRQLIPDAPRKVLKEIYKNSFKESPFEYDKNVHVSHKLPRLYTYSLRLGHDILPLKEKIFNQGSRLQRYNNPYCMNCDEKKKESPNHMLMECKAYSELRERAIQKHHEIISQEINAFPLEWNEVTSRGKLPENSPKI